MNMTGPSKTTEHKSCCNTFFLTLIWMVRGGGGNFTLPVGFPLITQ